MTDSAGDDREEKECGENRFDELIVSRLTLFGTWRQLRLVFGRSVLAEVEGVRGGRGEGLGEEKCDRSWWGGVNKEGDGQSCKLRRGDG
jgi:hypothetical protein